MTLGNSNRNGIYYVDVEDRPVIEAAIEKEKQKYANPVVTECMPLACFYDAEEYHQDYLDKNPAGYCHSQPAGCGRIHCRRNGRGKYMLMHHACMLSNLNQVYRVIRLLDMDEEEELRLSVKRSEDPLLWCPASGSRWKSD